MTLEEIKTKMNEEAVGRRYMADCCGVSYAYLCSVLSGHFKMTKKLQQKIDGVFRNLEIRKAKEARQPVETFEITENTMRPKIKTLEEMADWYKQDHSQEYARLATDIFNTDNLEDIPESIKKDLLSNETEKRILELFDIANRPLNLDEITVGYYRKYGEIKARNFFIYKLRRMCNTSNAKVVPTGSRGQYRKVV